MQRFNQTTLRANDLTFSALEQGSGPVVLCLHGFPDHARTFRFQLPALAGAGFRAIAPSLRGYDPSSQPPDGDYHVVRMAEDVVGWIDDLGEDRVHLIGHDWGGVIGYAVCAMAPERFRSLTTLGIPHPGRLRRSGFLKHRYHLHNSWHMLFFQLRGLADVAVELFDWALIEKFWRDWSPDWQLPDEEMASLKRTLRRPGVKKAALGYYRALFGLISRTSIETRRLLKAKVPVPTLALTGARDGCIDTLLHDELMLQEDFPAGLRVVRGENAGHFPHQERPDDINRLLIDWLVRNSGQTTGSG